jgi:hypothetical protein
MSAIKKMVDSFGRSPEENRKRLDILKRANEEAAANWDSAKWRQEFAADLTESILLGFDYETLVDRIIDTERVEFDGRVIVRETTGLKAFYMARGGYIEASQLTSSATELPRDMIGIHVSEYEDKFVTNFAQNALDLRSLAIQRMDAEVNRRVYTVLAEATPDGGDYYESAAGIDQTVLNQAIRDVRDATKTGSVAIVGRATVVDQIMDFDGFSNETQEEIRQKGVLGIYRGAPIVSLKNYQDEEGDPFVPANELLVIAKDVGKFAFYGGLKSKEYVEPDNWYWHYLARRDTGILVHHPERVRRLADTSIDP